MYIMQYEIHLKSFSGNENKIVECVSIEHLLSEIKNNYSNNFDIVKIINLSKPVKPSTKTNEKWLVPTPFNKTI